MQVVVIVNGVPVVTTVDKQDQTNQTAMQQLQATVQATSAFINSQPPSVVIQAVDQSTLVDVTLDGGGTSS